MLYVDFISLDSDDPTGCSDTIRLNKVAYLAKSLGYGTASDNKDAFNIVPN